MKVEFRRSDFLHRPQFVHPITGMRSICQTTGKICFKTKSDAKTQVKRLKRSIRTSPRTDPVVAYQCEHCRDWHVGHNSRPAFYNRIVSSPTVWDRLDDRTPE